MKLFIGIRLIDNLKWGRKDRFSAQSGSFYNRGYHGRYTRAFWLPQEFVKKSNGKNRKKL